MTLRLAGGVILALSAIAGSIVLIDKIGGSPIAPGTDSRLSWTTDAAGFTVSSNLAGDSPCMLRFWLTGDSSAVTARVSTGHPLAAVWNGDDASHRFVTICDTALVAESLQKFNWPSGSTVRLDFGVGPGESVPAILDWRVFFKENREMDSRDLAAWRRTWRRWSIGLFAFSLLGVAVTAYSAFTARGRGGQAPLPPLTAQECIVRLIAVVEGEPKEDTPIIQSILEKLLLRRLKPQAIVDSLEGHENIRLGMWFQATGTMTEHLDGLLEGLNQYRKDMEVEVS